MRSLSRGWRSVAAAIALNITCLVVPVHADDPIRYSEYGLIDVSGSFRTKNCWTVVFHVTLHNPYSTPIEDVHLVALLRSIGEPSHEIERLHTEFDVTIAPGESKSFDRNVEVNCTTARANVYVVGFAGRRGGTDLKEPSREIEREAAVLWH